MTTHITHWGVLFCPCLGTVLCVCWLCGVVSVVFWLCVERVCVCVGCVFLWLLRCWWCVGCWGGVLRRCVVMLVVCWDNVLGCVCA